MCPGLPSCLFNIDYFRGMNFLTGGTGIVGTRLLFDLVSQGEQVVALHRKNSDLSFVKKVFNFYAAGSGIELYRKIKWIEGDLLDPQFLTEQLANCRRVYHCAGLVSYQPADKERLLKVNVEGTANIVNACLEAGVEKLCHVSSVAALGQAKGEKTEKHFWTAAGKTSAYGLSKYLAEQEVWRAGEEGLKMVIVNPSIILGPAKKDQSSGRFFKVLRSGMRFFTGGGTGLVDVRDVSAICIKLMNSPVSQERFILSAENVLHRDLLTMAAHISGQKPPQLAAGRLAMELAWRMSYLVSLLSRKQPDITKETARASGRKNFYSAEKVRSTLPVNFIPVEESLKYYEKFYATL